MGKEIAISPSFTVSLGALFDIPNNARLEWATELIGQLGWRGTMVYRVAVLSTILLAGAACTIPLCAVGQKAHPSTPTPKAQLQKITPKVIFQGSCKGNVVESDGKKVITSLTHPADQLALARRLRAENPNWTLEDGLIWKTQLLSCDSVQIIELDDYKTHTVIEFLDASKKPVLAFEGPLALHDVGSTYVVATNILLPDGKVFPMQAAIQGPHCEVYSSQPDFQHHSYKDGPRLAAEAKTTWASHLIRMTCGAWMTNRADGHITKVNVDFNVMPPPPPVYGVTAESPPSWLLAPH
jgi:hypothetical protein